MRRAVAGALVAGLALGGAAALRDTAPLVVSIGPSHDVEAAIARVREGGVVRLEQGTYPRFDVDRRVTVLGVGAVARGRIDVVADGAALVGLAVAGGESGIRVEEADGVLLEAVSVRGSKLHGIELVEASATIRGARIADLRSPYAQGIEVRNTNGHPVTVVERSVIEGGREGLLSHVAPVLFRGNVVHGTTMRGIAITEMSSARVEDNVVVDARGTAYYCGDMSHCEFTGNVAGRVSGEARAPSLPDRGWGLVVFFHSVARVEGNAFSAPAGEVLTAVESRLEPQLSLPWAPGSAGVWPEGLLAVGVAGGTLVALYALARRRVPARWAGRAAGRRGRWRGRDAVALALVAGLAVQAFHMFEHTLQVLQVHVWGSPARSGLLGARFDVEWLHFTYNTTVLAFLVWLVVMRPRWLPPGTPRGVAAADGWLLAVVALQAYHELEHVVKVAQHVLTGARAAPGLLGGALDLVWVHFTINLAVFAAFALAALGYLWPDRERGRQPASPLGPLDGEAGEHVPVKVPARA